MRWSAQQLLAGPPELAIPGAVRRVETPEFAGMTFHEVMARSALNRVPASSDMPFEWTLNPYRGCTHACVYCFARGTHRYLDLDAGEDFDRQIIVKVNIAQVLAAELARPSWGHAHVALGTNTDPYQRAEGRYRLMPGIIDALVHSGTPFSVLTKGTLLRRDLPLLEQAAAEVPVELSMSIAVFDPGLQQSVEPGTATTAARLSTVRAAADLGFSVTVFLMPVLPYLTDSAAQLDSALGAIADAGAARVVHGALHLRPGAKEWYLDWIAREHPHLLRAYQGMYARSSYAPQSYRRVLAARITPLLERHGLDAPSRTGMRRGRPSRMQGGDGQSGDAPSRIRAQHASAAAAAAAAEEARQAVLF